MRVIVDSREQRPWDLAKFGCETKVCKLYTGDYSVEGMEEFISIERKSFGDFMGTMGAGRKRFAAAVGRMLEIPYRAIVVEATYQEIADGAMLNTLPYTQQRRLTPNHALGYADSLTMQGVPVMLVGKKYAPLQAYNLMRHAYNRLIEKYPNRWETYKRVPAPNLNDYRLQFGV